MLSKKSDSQSIKSILKREFRKKDLKINVVVDQFNAFVANCRKYNEAQKKHEETKYVSEKEMKDKKNELN